MQRSILIPGGVASGKDGFDCDGEIGLSELARMGIVKEEPMVRVSAERCCFARISHVGKAEVRWIPSDGIDQGEQVEAKDMDSLPSLVRRQQDVEILVCGCSGSGGETGYVSRGREQTDIEQIGYEDVAGACVAQPLLAVGEAERDLITEFFRVGEAGLHDVVDAALQNEERIGVRLAAVVGEVPFNLLRDARGETGLSHRGAIPRVIRSTERGR